MRFDRCVYQALSWLVLVSLIAVGGCDDTDDPTLTGIEVDPSVASITMEQEEQFSATAEYDDETTEDITDRAIWSSSDEDVATVDSSGLVSPVGGGTTTITAEFGEFDDTAELTVEVDAVLESCAVEPTDVDLAVGGSESMRVMGRYSDGSTDELSASAADWSSTDAAVAAVSDRGEVEAIASGEADIEASVDDIDCTSATVTVTADACTELTITADETTILVDGTIDLTATCVFGEDAIDVTDEVAWASDDDTVATVDAAGEVTGVAVGTTAISAIYTNTDSSTVSDDIDIEVIEAPLSSISVTPATATLNEVGATQAYTATCIYEGGTSVDCTTDVTWASSAEAVATISNGADTEGEATAVGEGLTEITATMGGTPSNTAVLNVDTVNVCVSITVAPTDPTIAAGTDIDFTATCTMNDGTTRTDPDGLTWSSSDTAVATIDSDGLATGEGEGTSAITATLSVEGAPVESDPVTLTVTTAEPVTLEIAPTVLTLANGTVGNFTATAIFTDDTTQTVTTEVTWSSDDTAIATISAAAGSEGEVIAEGAGTATITATYMGITDTASVVVTPAECTTLTIDPATASVAIGLTERLTATCLMSDGTNQTVTSLATWESSDTAVATVDSVAPDHGTVHGVAPGNATITANYDGASATAEITVTDNVCESIEISSSETTISDGSDVDFTATCIMTDSSTVIDPDGITWNSSDTAVAAIDADGLATAREPGTTDITASLSVGGTLVTSDAVTLTVTDAVVLSLEISPNPLSLPVGTIEPLTATATLSDSTTQTVTAAATWSPADDTIASVSNTAGAEGEVTGEAEGTTSVTATYGGATATASVVVTNAVCESVAITPNPASVPAGRDVRLTATCSMSDDTTRDVTSDSNWTTGDPAIATVGNLAPDNGLVHGVATDSTTTITATYGTVTPATATVNVTGGLLENITIEPASPDPLPVGLDQQFEARGHFSDGSTPLITADVTWSSSPSGIVSSLNDPGNEGLATGLSAGTVVITATDPDTGETASVTLEVTSAIIESIEISPLNASLPATYNQPYQAQATLTDGNVVDVTASVTWSVAPADGSVATISNAAGSEGIATGVAVGEAIITATDPDTAVVSNEATLTVTDAYADTLTVTPAGTSATLLEMNVTDEQSFTATVTFSDGTSRDVTSETNWTLSDNTVGNLTAAGLFTATATGTTQVIAVYRGIEDRVYVDISEAPTLESVTVNLASPNSPVGYTTQATCTAHYSAGDPQNVTTSSGSSFVSSDTAVATVTSDGVITAVAAGETDITCSYGGLDSADFETPPTFTVEDCAIDTITILNESEGDGAINPPQDTTHQLSARAAYTGGCSARDITTEVAWRSLDETVALVSNADGSEGLVTAVGAADDTTQIEARIVGVASDTIGVIISGACYESIRIVDVEELPVGARLDANLEAYTSTGEWVDVSGGISWSRIAVDGEDDRFGFDDVTAGVIEGLSVGQQDLQAVVAAGTCSGENIEATTTVTVTDLEMTGVEIRNIPGVLTAPSTHQYTAWAIYSDGSSYEVTSHEDTLWNSTVTAVANISATGEVTTIDVGTTTITVSHGSFVDSTSLEVAGWTLTGVELRVAESAQLGDSSTAPVDVYLHYQCVALYPDAPVGDQEQNVTTSPDTSISADDPTVLDVTSTVVSGRLRARTRADGSTTVTCTYGDFESSLDLEVDDTLTVNSLAISPAAPSLVLGEVSRLQANATFSNGAVFDVTRLSDWSSADPTSVSVTPNTGVITGLAATAGVAVSADYHSASDTVSVSVSDDCYESLVVTPASDSIAAGETSSFTATATQSDTTEVDVTTTVRWTSSDDGIASIGEFTGVATGEASGTATLTATLSTGLCGGLGDSLTDTATLVVSDAVLTSLSITCPETMVPYELGQCTASGDYSDDRTGVDVTDLVEWSRLGTAVSIDSATGEVEALAAGSSTITAEHTATGLFDTAVITVSDCTLDSITVIPVDGEGSPIDTVDVPVGFTQPFTATGTWVDGDGVTCDTIDVTNRAAWTSDDDTVVTMDGPLMTAVDVGTTDVVATFETIPGSFPVEVNDATLTEIDVLPDTPTIHVGETLDVVAVGTFSDTSTRPVTGECAWLSTVPATASFTGPATVIGNEDGTTTLRCTIGGVVGNELLTVDPSCLDHIELVASEASPLPTNVPVNFTVLGYYSDEEPPTDLTDTAGWSWTGDTLAVLTGTPDSEGDAWTEDSSATQNLTATITSSNICDSSDTVSDSLDVEVNVDLVLEVLTITPDPFTVADGGEQQLTAMGSFSNDATFDLTERVSWITSDRGIVTVQDWDGTMPGLAEGIAAGDAIISAVDGLISADALAQVSGAVLESIEIRASETIVDDDSGVVEIPEGGHTVQLTAWGHYADDSVIEIAVDWEISAPADTTAAVISVDGLVTSGDLDSSDVTITVTATDSAGSGVSQDHSVTIAAGALTYLEIVEDAVEIPEGETNQWEAHVSNDDRTTWYQATHMVVWSTDDNAIATVSNTAGDEGLVTGVAPGLTTIRATRSTLFDAVDVEILDLNLEYIEVQPMTMACPSSTGHDYDLVGHYSDGSFRPVSGADWFAESMAGDPWYNFYCADNLGDGQFAALADLPGYVGGETCDGVTVQIEACLTVGVDTFCTFHAFGGSTHEGYLEVDFTADACDHLKP